MIRKQLSHAFTGKAPRKFMREVDEAILGLSDALLKNGRTNTARKLREATNQHTRSE